MRRPVLAVLVSAALLAALTACTQASASGKVDVVASFYPLAFVAREVGGSDVAVRDLTPAGVEPHEIELTVRQVVAIHDSDLTIYLRGLAPAVDEAVHEARVRLDVATVTDLRRRNGGLDPHVWLDPLRMQRIVVTVQEALAAADPAHAADYVARAANLTRALARLDADFRAGLRHCERTEIVTSHAAFGYLARRYGLTQVGITGLIPDAEPAPGRLAEVIRIARAHKATTIYFESIVSPKVARTVATSVGAKTAVLDPLETQPDGTDYIGGMRRNLSTLRAGLGCP